jgi:hypothetical protein
MNISASRRGYLKRRSNRGLTSTSAISPSCDSDVTTLNSSRRYAATTCPGGPVGLRNAETQTLVSSRATSGTAFRLDLVPSARHFRLDDLLTNRLSAAPHPSKQVFELPAPIRFSTECDQDAGPLLQSEGLQGSEDTLFVHGSKGRFYPMSFFRQRHGTDYTDGLSSRQVESMTFSRGAIC